MNSEERQLINSLFDRMRQTNVGEKDRDAEALINQAVRQIPDSAYILVQSVLVQEHTLQQAGQRIEQLEEHVRQLEAQARAAPASGGSFLGGLFGGGSRPAQQPMAASPQSGGFGGAPPARSPWGQPARAPMQAAPAAGGGSFMRSAMATAAGVAGGMLLADSIRNMMSGGQSQTGGTQQASDPMGPEPTTQEQASSYYDDADNDPGTHDAASEDAGWGGGDDIDV
jgi:hypothetical protein